VVGVGFSFLQLCFEGALELRSGRLLRGYSRRNARNKQPSRKKQTVL